MYQTTFDEKSRIWSGASSTSLFNPNVSVGQVMLDALAKNPKKIGQISANNGIHMTNGEIRMRTIRAAQNLVKMGYGKGDVFSIIAKNHHFLAPIIFALMSIGAPVNTLGPSFDKKELENMLQTTQPMVVFCDVSIVLKVREVLHTLQMTVPIFTFGGKVDGASDVEDLFVETGMEDCFVPVDIGDGTNHPAAIICTTGTTGMLKAVCLSHASIIEKVSNKTLNNDSVLLCFSLAYGLTGFSTLFFSTNIGGTRIITTEPFTPELMIRLVEEYKVTYLLTPPSILAETVQSEVIRTADLSSLTCYLCAGSAVATELCERMNKYMPNGNVYIGYGMSELAGLATLNYSKGRPKSVGKMLMGFRMKIINNKGESCGVHEDGEICFFLKYQFLGYFGNDSATKETIDDEGWIHSGDIGHFDDEGYLYIVDRKKDILRYKNYQISPSEIEKCILNGNSEVKHVCVVGVPDIACTDLPAAVIVLRTGANVSELEIEDLVKGELADFKRLRGGVYFIDKLPMFSFKILRRLVKDIAISRYTERMKHTDNK